MIHDLPPQGPFRHRNISNQYPPAFSLDEAIGLLGRFKRFEDISESYIRMISAIINRDCRTVDEACQIIRKKYPPEKVLLGIKGIRERLNRVCSQNQKQKI